MCAIQVSVRLIEPYTLPGQTRALLELEAAGISSDTVASTYFSPLVERLRQNATSTGITLANYAYSYLVPQGNAIFEGLQLICKCAVRSR
jgi:hypothetical protein